MRNGFLLVFAAALLTPSTHFGQYVFPIAGVPADLQAEVVMTNCSEGRCTGAGYVKINRKPAKVFFQTIHFKDQVLTYPKWLQLKEGDTAIEYDLLPVRFTDINFDGHSDLLLGSLTTSQFYLYDKEEKQFELHSLTGKFKNAVILSIRTDTIKKKLSVHSFKAGNVVRDDYNWNGSKPLHVFSITVQRGKDVSNSADRSYSNLGPVGSKAVPRNMIRFAEDFETKWGKYEKRGCAEIIVVIRELNNGRWKKRSKRFTPEEYEQLENAEWRP